MSLLVCFVSGRKTKVLDRNPCPKQKTNISRKKTLMLSSDCISNFLLDINSMLFFMFLIGWTGLVQRWICVDRFQWSLLTSRWMCLQAITLSQYGMLIVMFIDLRQSKAIDLSLKCVDHVLRCAHMWYFFLASFAKCFHFSVHGGTIYIYI